MAGVYSKERKRKLENENRAFQAEWEGDFFFTKGKKEGTALCLICRETVHGNKRYNLNRHYTSIHSQFEEKFPKKFKIREEKLQSLKKSFACERSTLFNAMNKNELTTKASYQVTEILAQKMKPFSDAEIVKECVVTVCKTLFSHLPNSKQILDEVSKLQLSDSTCMRRSQDLAANIALKITDELQQSKYFSLALDSSTDITSISQLLLFVKYVSKDCVVKENFLGMIPMTGQTRGVDYLNTIVSFFKERSIDLKKVFSACTDGCPSMLGRNIGFVQLLKKHLENDNLLSFHCIIHQESLAVKFGENFSCVMKQVVKIVNFIRSNELNRRTFQEFLKELISQYGDVLYHTEVRWLSKGKVLERFFSIRHEITLFLATKEKEYPDVYNFSWWLKEQKLNMYIEELSNSDYSSFPSVKTLFHENPDESQDVSDLIKLLTDLKNEMSLRFSDFRKYQEPFRLVENPWSITTANIAHLSVFGYEARDLKNELFDLQHDTELKSVFEEKKKNKAHYEFWKAVEKDKFPNLIDCAQKILCFFASTYVCESTFSKLKFIKNKYRSRLTNENVENILRISVSSQPANIDAILESCERFRHSTSTN
ncbi:hypothetical protein QTP88_029992 [Uroleucon formosanum]